MFCRRGLFRIRVARRVQAVLDAKAREDLSVSPPALSRSVSSLTGVSMPQL
jgi:hypothetical protein